MPDFCSIFDFFSRRRHQKVAGGEDDRELFVERYRAFRELLGANNEVLLIMGDMQEKAGGSFLFDRTYTSSSYENLARGVAKIIDNLNVLTGGRYGDLLLSYRRVDSEIRSRLSSRISIPETGPVLPLRDLNAGSSAAAGGKFASLGELFNILDIPVPPGFVITTHAYRNFISGNRIGEILEEQMRTVDLRRYESLLEASAGMQRLIREAPVPPEIEEAVYRAYQGLCRETGADGLRVSVRSSAVQEDIFSASFAGQYKSVLNVTAPGLLAAYKEVLASQFTPRALFYYGDKGFAVEEMAMAAGVLAMVEARASGVLYSRDPSSPLDDNILINAVWGLGSYAVGGKVPTENCRVAGGAVERVDTGKKTAQEVMLVAGEEGGTREVPVPGELRGRPPLSADQALRLAAFARRSEEHFGRPQDMEWALDSRGEIYVLQSRPLRPTSLQTSEPVGRPVKVEGHRLLLDRGSIACRGVGAGPVYIIGKEADLSGFPEGAVMVIRHTYPEYAAVLKKASAVVADIGSSLGHLATVAREYNVPALFSTGEATRILQNGLEVTVDAVYANVYEGYVDELVRKGKPPDSGVEAPALNRLREILQLITPLNLTDPRSPEFSPQNCKTLHDITRFAHEVSLRAILDLSKDSHFAEKSAKQLVSGVPLKWWVIDLEDGLSPDARGGTVTPEQIVSVPMRALWAGMTAMPWKGPPPVDSKGFLSVMFSATTDPSIDPAVGKRFADRNYILVAGDFCNVSTRLGFHFSTIEAFVSDRENQNYIGFVYTGGGADPARRERRAALISRILETYDFRVAKKGDTLFARIEGYGRGFLEDRLKILGHVIVHTRQMDMVMYNDALVDWYYKEMMQGIEKHLELKT